MGRLAKKYDTSVEISQPHDSCTHVCTGISYHCSCDATDVRDYESFVRGKSTSKWNEILSRRSNVFLTVKQSMILPKLYLSQVPTLDSPKLFCCLQFVKMMSLRYLSVFRSNFLILTFSELSTRSSLFSTNMCGKLPASRYLGWKIEYLVIYT